jgi:ssDNA-binding Zn-finger/Zn-ribbon topoisomerase 1
LAIPAPYLPPVTPPTIVYDAVLALANIGLAVYLATKLKETSHAVPTDVAGTKTKCKKEEEKCPVCGLLPNPVPGSKPAYLSPPRVPKDSETLPPLTAFKRTSIIVKGARVYETPFDFRHLDTLHKGKGAEIETYDKRHNHLGAICPQCGAFKPGSLVPGRKLPKN